MGKNVVLIGMLLILLEFTSGCAQTNGGSEGAVLPVQENVPLLDVADDMAVEEDRNFKWSGPPSIMVEGKLYLDLQIVDRSIDIGDDEILGYISSVISINDVPQQDGEANYEVLGAPYARWKDEEYSDTIIIYYNQVWHVLVPNGYD